jgi:hypothetical protein
MDRDPDPEEPFEKTYTAKGRGAIEFRRAMFNDFAMGTPIEGMDEVLSMGDSLEVKSKNKAPRQLANMFRTLALYTFGGIWVDTDTLLMRNLRPLLEYSGEFATQLAWSNLYNNNFMGLRAKSPVAWDMLVTISVTGLPPASQKESEMKKYCKYVTQDGGLCYGVWYWNHGSIQRAVFQNRGLVPFPTTYSDPGYQGCYAPYLMGWHGGLPMNALTIEEVIELLRGTFIIHTRAYNAKKPMSPKSNFWQLYTIFRAGAELNMDSPQPIYKLGKRTAAEEVEFDRVWARRQRTTSQVNFYNNIEPAWYPKGVRTRVGLKSKSIGKCLAGQKKGFNELGRNPPVDAVGRCAQATEKQYGRSTWAWNPGHDGTGGYLRPWSVRGIARPLCLDGDAQSGYGRRTPVGMQVTLVGCSPIRRSQQWFYVLGRFVNAKSKECLTARRVADGDERLQWKERTKEERNVVLELTPCVGDDGADAEHSKQYSQSEYLDAQRWEMTELQEHIENRFGIM